MDGIRDINEIIRGTRGNMLIGDQINVESLWQEQPGLTRKYL